jgi:HEAT repeat protein
MARIFISYCRDDGPFARLVSERLKREGLAAWQDRELRPGEDWGDEIDQALQEADTVIVVLSASANASAYVSYEWAFALGAGLRVIPLLIGLRREDLHPRLAHLQWLDFTNPKRRPWTKLLAALKEPPAPRRGAKSRPSRSQSPAERAAEALDSPNPDERLHAVETLAQMKDPAARDRLAAALNHTVREVRIAAASALAAGKDLRAIPGLLEGACHMSDGWRFEQQLRELDAAAVPQLIGYLGHTDAGFRKYSARALGEIGDASSIAHLSAALQDPDAEVRRVSIEALAAFQAQAPMELIAGCIKDESDDVRREAAIALGKIGTPEAYRKLAGALTDSNHEVRFRAACGLEDARDPALIPALTDRIRQEEDRQTRSHVAEALRKSADRAAVPGLLLAIQDESVEVRMEGQRGLVEFGGPEAIRALLDIIRKPEVHSRSGAAEALAKFHDKDPAVVAALLEVLRDPEKLVRSAAAGALGEIADPATVPALIEALHDQDEQVRSTAADALGVIRDVSAIPALVEALSDVNYRVRWRAAEALNHIGDASAVPGLADALNDPSGEVRTEAVQALERINTMDARTALAAHRRRQPAGA